jgi:dihydroxyacetone kinase DhaKLM complex PTS-EIIA-like component DhaM
VVGIVVVGHSADVARGVVAMIAQAAPAVPAGGAGGLSGGRLGTNAEEVAAVLRAILGRADGDGVLVLLDLGSAAMAVEIALEELAPKERALVSVSEGPFVEGAVAAAVVAAHGGTSAAVRAAAESALDRPKLPRD